MKSFTIRLAGQYFTICPVCDYIREYCRDYIVADDTEDAMRFRIATTQSDIDFEREKSAREDTKEGIPIRQFSDAYSIDPYCNYGKPGTKWEEIAFNRMANHDMYPEKVYNR